MKWKGILYYMTVFFLGTEKAEKYYKEDLEHEYQHII
jgi:hypothetical protein